MRHLTTVTLIAMLAVVPASALAQDAGKKANQQQARQANFGNLISALNNISAEINELEALKNIAVGDVTVVNVADLLKGNNVEAFNNALNKNNVEVARLTNVLNNNTVLTDVLKNNNVAISRVVAVDVLSGGGVTLFVQPAQ